MNNEQKTAEFYDDFWPANVPNLTITKQYLSTLLPKDQYFENGLDAGCGTGVTSIALSEKCKNLWAIDISKKSLAFAKKLANKHQKININFKVASVVKLPFKNANFDLVFCWGVIHHTINPSLAISELCRVLKNSGVLVIAAYQKTWLTPFYELIRIICINLPKWGQTLMLNFLILIVKIFTKLFVSQTPKRADSTIKALVKDWFFVPQKYFFTKEELKEILRKHQIDFKIVEEYNGRFKSTSNIVFVGKKTQII